MTTQYRSLTAVFHPGLGAIREGVKKMPDGTRQVWARYGLAGRVEKDDSGKWQIRAIDPMGSWFRSITGWRVLKEAVQAVRDIHSGKAKKVLG